MRNWGSWAPRTDRHTAITFAQNIKEKQRLNRRCAILERYISACESVGDTPRVLDVQRLHRIMFRGLVPSLPGAVGVFRGTKDSSVEFAERIVRNDGSLENVKEEDWCVLARDVPAEMDTFSQGLGNFWKDPDASAFLQRLAYLTHTFFHIHPFLDGNGHVWRAAVLILVRRAGLQPNPAWRIDQKNYGADMSFALQQYPHQPKVLEDLLKRLLLRDDQT